MKLTNNLNFPEWIADVLRWCHGQYERGTADFTASELVAPVQQRALLKKFADVITRDISQIVDLVIGKAIHLFFETALKNLGIDYIEFEVRLTAAYVVAGKLVTVSGQFDAYDTKTRTLWDFKAVKASAVGFGAKDDYASQLNIYADLIKNTGKPEPVALRNLYIIKDWSPIDLLRDKSGEYPKAPLIIIELPLMSAVERQAYIVGRIQAHQAGADGCSSAEMWEKPGKLAVKKPGAARAMNGGLFDPSQRAEAEAMAIKNKAEIEVRPALRTRCQFFCSVSELCPQYAEFVKPKEGATV